MVIYWDIVFILNIFMNFIILWLTAVTASKNVHLLRLCLGAITGSIFLFALFYPSLHFFLLFYEVFAFITDNNNYFFPSNFKDLIKLLVYFYIVSFIIGGAAFVFLFYRCWG